MEKDFIFKLKNLFIFLLKSAILLYICHLLMFVLLIFGMLVTIFYATLIEALSETKLLGYLAGGTMKAVQICLFYLLSKKLGIIKVLDKLPFWGSLLIAIVYDIILVYCGTIGVNNWFQYKNQLSVFFKTIIYFSLRGYGYIYTFLTYKLARLLSKKYPKVFGWLGKLFG